MTSLYTVLCMLCGRQSGQTHAGRFFPAADAPLPVRERGRVRCGFCGGSLYLEPDDSGVIPYTLAESLAQPHAS